ncbi:sodium/hydrogen exchanger 9B2-like [Argiope bruennichi]|uniref:sodium/hydrogen exchanger 9B2-like n=1 Tax=Argiope bruennichi TaxID=94029 RepID=UPI002494583B|nr:sodium/hydrogen exchanger 9B2-like [Argiope bruennichi]
MLKRNFLSVKAVDPQSHVMSLLYQSGKSLGKVENQHLTMERKDQFMEISTLQSNEYFPGELYSEIEDSEKPKRWYHHVLEFILPSRNYINLYITRLFVVFFFFLFIFGMLGKQVLPGSEIFGLLFMAILAVIGGKILKFMKLPPLIGMMIVGFLYRNMKFNPYFDDISWKTIASVREIALAYILMRAGLGIDAEKLMKLKLLVLRLVLIPCICEASLMAVISHFLLGLPWIFAIMLGWLMSAISPEVVMPLIINLEQQGYGINKGINTLIVAALSLDDILAIAAFTVCFSIAFSTADLTWTIIKGPLEPLVGFAYGAVFGVIFWYFPSIKMKNAKLVYYNILLLSFGCMAILFLSDKYRLPGAGPLGCITLAFVAGINFRKNERQFRGVQTVAKGIWIILEPFLFALIGAEVTVETLQNSAGFGALSILCGLSFRCLVTYFVCSGAGFVHKEKLFIVVSWISKATLQAAIGSQALDFARQHDLDEALIQYGTTVLNVSVLSIVMTAPLGAVLISLLGPVLLTQDVIRSDSDEHFEEEDANAVQTEEQSSAVLVEKDK